MPYSSQPSAESLNLKKLGHKWYIDVNDYSVLSSNENYIYYTVWIEKRYSISTTVCIASTVELDI